MKLNKMENFEIVKEKVKASDEDERRKLKAVFNGNFTAKQLIILEVKKDSFLGGHYHNYNEIFYCVKGEADYTFINIDTKEKKLIKVEIGEKVNIPTRTYHKAFLKQGTILIGVSEQEYVSDELNNLSYEE